MCIPSSKCMKRSLVFLLCVLLAVTMLLALSACDDDGSDATTTSATTTEGGSYASDSTLPGEIIVTVPPGYEPF